MLDLQSNPVRFTLDKINETAISLFDECVEEIEQNADKIDQAYYYLSDAESRKLYTQEIAVLAARLFNPNFAEAFNPMPRSQWDQLLNEGLLALPNLRAPELKYSDPKEARAAKLSLVETFYLQGYRYKDLVKVEQGEIFLDCGAYLGDTALWAYQNGAAQVYCFEPCEAINRDLQANLAAYNHPAENVFPFAISNTNTKDQLHVWNGDSASAGLYRTEGQTISLESNDAQLFDIQCIRLDDWCKEHNVEPSFIKMDIEGAEVDALHGGAETIKRLKPKMAVCLYHRLEHMWEIPLLLKELVPEYKFYCRKNHYRYDVVLYATV